MNPASSQILVNKLQFDDKYPYADFGTYLGERPYLFDSLTLSLQKMMRKTIDNTVITIDKQLNIMLKTSSR